eukprot:5789643-Heterocapsa_arctica.AAC.1
MFKSEDYDTFEMIFDKLVSYASTKHSLKLSNTVDRPAKDPNAMDVGGFNEKNLNIQCWVFYGHGHIGKDCPTKGKGKGKGKDKGGKTNYKGYKCK